MTSDKLTRRTLGSLAAAGVGVPLLAACGDDTSSAADPGSGPGSSSARASASSAPSTSAGTDSIDVGGGQVFADQEVVVTQPAEGEFKCFTAVCSHQGCLVSDVSDGTINCDCHGSKYSIETGDVEEGPATFALAEVPISVTGDQITLA
jgi:Rieske Fe-S protein